MRKIPLGETAMSLKDFMEVLQDSKEQFTGETYDIFDNNCNHFSNFCSELLVGVEIPNQYANQANEFKNTPIGNLLKGFQVNPNQNNNNYNISYEGVQKGNQGISSSDLYIYILIYSPYPCIHHASSCTSSK